MMLFLVFLDYITLCGPDYYIDYSVCLCFIVKLQIQSQSYVCEVSPPTLVWITKFMP